MTSPFSKVGIVGVGLIGGSIGLALKKAKPTVQILGVGRERARLELARANGTIDEFSTELASLRDCDLVILATPVDHILEVLGDLGPCLRPEAVATDVGSTKRMICEAAWRKLPATVEFIGGHPVAGRELAGVENSLPELFQGAPYVLCPSPGRFRQNLEKLMFFVEMLGARVCLMTPEEHDRSIAWVSHLPQLLSTALANAISAQRTDISGSGLRDMLRLAGSPYSIWQGIFATNRDNIDLALGALIQHLEQVRSLLRDGHLSDEFARAGQIRKGIR